MTQRFGTSNPNYRLGNYCGDFGSDPGNNLAVRMALQDRLRSVLVAMNKPLDDRSPSPVTRDELQWVLAIQREWPEWAQAIMRGNGWNRKSEGDNSDV